MSDPAHDRTQPHNPLVRPWRAAFLAALRRTGNVRRACDACEIGRRTAYDLRADGPRLGVPVLLAWGARDIILPKSAARRTQAAIPGADLQMLPTGHVVFASDPDGWKPHWKGHAGRQDILGHVFGLDYFQLLLAEVEHVEGCRELRSSNLRPI